MVEIKDIPEYGDFYIIEEGYIPKRERVLLSATKLDEPKDGNMVRDFDYMKNRLSRILKAKENYKGRANWSDVKRTIFEFKAFDWELNSENQPEL